jgi:hypothetical protein
VPSVVFSHNNLLYSSVGKNAAEEYMTHNGAFPVRSGEHRNETTAFNCFAVGGSSQKGQRFLLTVGERLDLGQMVQ